MIPPGSPDSMVTLFGASTTLIESGVFREHNPMLVFSRLLMVLAWVYGVVRIWRFRALPHANQALAGALALLLSNTLILFRSTIPYDVLLFFVAMGQMVLAISFGRLFGLLRHLMPLRTPGNGSCDECPLIPLLLARPYESELSRTFFQVVVGIGGLGIASMFLQYLTR